MVEFMPGGRVRISNPTRRIRISSPGFVHGVHSKEGAPGPPGRNITSVVRTSGDGTPGSTDVYTITFSDSTTSTFSIVNGTNGADGGAIGTAGGDLSGTYPNPTVRATAITAVAATRTQGGAEAVAAGSATTGTSTLNCASASVFTISPTGNITLAPSSVPATGTACTITVIISQGASAYTVTMPGGAIWLGSAPTQAANKKCAITMLTVDGGTTWICSGGVQA